MKLCFYRPDYNILTYLREHFIPNQPIFFSDTVLSMIISMWPVAERKSILQKILMTSYVDIGQVRKMRTRQTLQTTVTSDLWNLTCFNLVTKRPKSHIRFFWCAETFSSHHLQLHAKTKFLKCDSQHPSPFFFSPQTYLVSSI